MLSLVCLLVPLNEFYQPVILRSNPWQFKDRPTPPQTSQENSILHANVLSVTHKHLKFPTLAYHFRLELPCKSQNSEVLQKNMLWRQKDFLLPDQWKDGNCSINGEVITHSDLYQLQCNCFTSCFHVMGCGPGHQFIEFISFSQMNCRSRNGECYSCFSFICLLFNLSVSS